MFCVFRGMFRNKGATPIFRALLQKSEMSLTRRIKNYLNKKYFDFGFVEEPRNTQETRNITEKTLNIASLTENTERICVLRYGQ